MSAFKCRILICFIFLFAGHSQAAGNDGQQILQTRLEKLEQLLEHSSDYQRYLLLDTTASTAFQLGQHQKAKAMCGELIQTANNYSNDWNYGNALHRAHIIGGKIALAENDVETAKRKLLAAGNVNTSELLNHNGPDFSLANELLQRGEINAVANYLQQCKKLWRPGRAHINTWLKSIGQGETPELMIPDTEQRK